MRFSNYGGDNMTEHEMRTDCTEKFRGVGRTLDSHNDRLCKIEDRWEVGFKLSSDEWERMRNKTDMMDREIQKNVTAIAVNSARFGWILALFTVIMVAILGLYVRGAA